MAHVTLFNYTPRMAVRFATTSLRSDIIQQRDLGRFDDTGPEFAYFPQIFMPGQYAGGTLKATVGYYCPDDSTGDVVWVGYAEAYSEGEGDMEGATSFDTGNSLTDTIPGTAGQTGFATITLTNKDGVVAGDLFRLLLERNADDGSDTATGDAVIMAVDIWEDT